MIGVLIRPAGVLVKTAPTKISATEIRIITSLEGPFRKNFRAREGTFMPSFLILIIPEK